MLVVTTAVPFSEAGAGVAADPLDLTTIHDEHANFVWLSLQRLGVREADLDDMLQEVFVVVHKHLRTFDGSSKMTTWLFGIATRVASDHRRRAHVRREELVDTFPPAASNETSPEDALVAQQARRELDDLLDALDVEKRAVFVMYEIDELACEEIAAIVGVPINTVYSRLHAARKSFEKAVQRKRARDPGKGGSS